MNQMTLQINTDFSFTFTEHPIQRLKDICTLFSGVHRTFSNTGHIWKLKASLKRTQKNEIIPCILSDHNKIARGILEHIQIHGD